MKVISSTVLDILARLRVYFHGGNGIHYDNEEPFRSELYSTDQMNRHGEVVARSHKLLKIKSPDQLLKRLDENEETLLEVRKLLIENIRSHKTVAPAAEWLLDNFYLIEEQIIIAKKHLPKGYSEGLPCLDGGNSPGMPRVYDIVLEIISHSDGRVDVKSLSSFISSYQKNTLLTIGELWAIPIMLRLAVIENLRRVSRKIALHMIDNNLADFWADAMTKTISEEPGNLILTIADMARSKLVLSGPFVAGFIRRLQGTGPSLALPLNWMEQQLSGIGLTSMELVREDNQKQAADQVSVRNSIGTLRFLSATDWKEFVETLSSVEQVLRRDMAGIYPLMDFATRDSYRHAVEAISKASPLSETEVAQKVLELTVNHKHINSASPKMNHVGYYLIDKGLNQMEIAVGMRNSLYQKLIRFSRRMPVFLYLLSITLLTLLSACGMIYIAYHYGSSTWLIFSCLALLSISGSAQLAVSLVNWVITIWVKPRLLPRMDFSGGIPDEFRTLVIVPTMLSGMSYIEQLIEALEIRFLANKDANLHFGLLTDFLDADSAIMPDDDVLLELVSSKIIELNQKYKQSDHDIFFLFHRPRKWNDSEHCWMGYERKRGKISALNAFIQGRGRDEFSLIVGEFPVKSRVRYVITLDSDTQLPRESAWKCIATMAHPLNQAIYNSKKRRVTEGYGILQPRVDSAIPKGSPSLYLRMQGNLSGIDPYTRVSSDVYQDVFAEGSFIGKGIYDVEIFEQAVNEIFRENNILSHDLIEGCYTRSGLISDVILYEESPSQYEADVKRRYRWIRGDWQISPWIMPFITAINGRLITNKLSVLSKWKIFDNLRRSLLPLTLLLLLLMGWLVLPFPMFWTLTVAILILLPLLAAAGWRLIHKPVDLPFIAHVSEVGISVRVVFFRFLFDITVMPYEAFKYTDAVLRTNWRMMVIHKRLLEWIPSATASAHSHNDIRDAYSKMWIAPLMAISGMILISFLNPLALLFAAPILFLWFVSPAIAWQLSQPETEQTPKLTDEQMIFLHKSARKTWLFFEQFVTAIDNWLPPDNFQEQPVATIAHRTSPSNMGLALLANLSAYDFGYIGIGELTLRCNSTFQSMLKLERYKGHFYNWYDTVSLLPLQPRYVSTVDSGNLFGHLLTLKQGFIALPTQHIFTSKLYEGLRTTSLIVRDFSNGRFTGIIESILALLNSAALETSSLSEIKKHLDEVISFANQLIEQQTNTQTNLYKWTNRLLVQIQLTRDDLIQMVPWLELLPVPQHFNDLEITDHIPSLMIIKNMPDVIFSNIDQYEQQENTSEQRDWLIRMRTSIAIGSKLASDRIKKLEQMAGICEDFCDVDYSFLFNKTTRLLRIGYNVDDQRKDDSYYDLLASEERLGIFVAIAQGKLPQESWFSLGRLLTNSVGEPILLSWSGSMFEYLMPQLVMPTFENTLLDQTCKATVKRQIEYAAQRRIPWGISESAYNRADANQNYQYRAFGVPGLGLKRGLEDDLVIAPYASMMALMVSPHKACTNLQLLSSEGFEGEFGFYEAIDYTSGRLPRGKDFSIIPSYMVHHQGMGLLSFACLLLKKPMQKRFLSELRFQATIMLLQERIPRATIFHAHTADLMESRSTSLDIEVRTISNANTRIPEIQLLSNGSYQVMITNSGGGYSRWKNIAVNRWREDVTKDDCGIFCYIKDVKSGDFWSNTYQPTLKPTKNYKVIFSQGHVEFRRLDFGIDTKTEIVISPEDDTEMRRIRLMNKTQSVRILEITSYAEIVLADQSSDEAHPAFSNLFVQTEIKPEHKAVFCTRRPRSEEETPPWMFHLMDVHGGVTIEKISYETDRMQFIGRGKSLVHPQAMEVDLLSGNQGAVLDPIMSIRYRITIKPGDVATFELIYGISETKESCEAMMLKYKDQHLKKRAFELSWTHSQVLLRQINATEADAQLYNRLTASVIYNNAVLRADATVINSNLRGQSGLWSHSVSGDLPIVLLHIYKEQSLELVRQMVQAHAYWRLKGLAVDLVIWNEEHNSYRQILQEQILGLITTSLAVIKTAYGKPGNIYVKTAEQLSTEDRLLFESVARVIIFDNKGTLSEQINNHYKDKLLPAMLELRPIKTLAIQNSLPLPEHLLFFNGTGGFTPEGTEYKIVTDNKETTPAPWVNVIANPNFGTVISESGSAYTWAINAHEYRITPWSDDPVSDIGGEAFYLRNEQTGYFWSASPFPAKRTSPYITTHGFGYTIFEHIELGIYSEMSVFVDTVLPVKFVVLKVKNFSGRESQFSATGFLEIILGDVRSKTNMHIVSEWDSGNGSLLLRNKYNSAFTDRVTFFKVDGADLSFTTDRSEFIGRNRNLADPQALYRKRLSGRNGAAMDPCASLQVKFDLHDGGEKEIIFQLGNEENMSAAIALILKFTNRDTVMQSFQNVKDYWKEVLSTVQIFTPDRSLNILANGWLTYQTIACRMFARSGFYQSGGAFGFRDQLQDVLALLPTRPMLAREQILLSASRQFAEGDVQHWWHPPGGRGVRTHCSDDLLWLPFVVSRYIASTGDINILAVSVGFLESRPLLPEEDSLFDLPVSGHLSGTLYDHCVRAIHHSLQFGKHGLPLIGSGDWNDGMDRVGNKGTGESVWLAFFQYDVLTRFSEIAIGYGDSQFADTCKKEAIELQSNIEASGWDGQWYLRAYFDDGTPLGSNVNDECRIDAIAQSWSVLSGAANDERRVTAMASLDKYLVKREMNLIQLLDPPFDAKGRNPGYIQGYVPGVRENGGQYSHAAIWAMMAFAALGDREKVWELFHMINPMSHSSDAASVRIYKVEPYVMAADIYANESHRGRGGWTWYTGSSGWMYQFITGALIGFELLNDKLRFRPCFPLEWPSVSIVYRYRNTTYKITVFQLNNNDSSWWKVDDQQGDGDTITLMDDLMVHEAEVHIQIVMTKKETTFLVP